MFTYQLKFRACFVIFPHHISRKDLSAGVAWVPAPRGTDRNRAATVTRRVVKMFLSNWWRCKVHSRTVVHAWPGYPYPRCPDSTATCTRLQRVYKCVYILIKVRRVFCIIPYLHQHREPVCWRGLGTRTRDVHRHVYPSSTGI